MRHFISVSTLFFFGIFASFSQASGIEKGTYLSTNKGQKIKLNLLDDHKYELVFYSGSYEIQGDSLLFTKDSKSENNFDVSFTHDKKAKNIKVKFPDPSYYSFYIGTQKGKDEVQYQRISDIKTKSDPNYAKIDLEFEIEKGDYLYLVYEDYNGKSSVYKYALPNDVSEIIIDYRLEVLSDLKISGFYDRSTNELKVSEQGGRNPLVFTNEKNPQPFKTSKVVPVENQTISNWTYPGKANILVDDGFGTNVIVDSAIVGPPATDKIVDPNYVKYDFKLKVENNLSKAIAATKQENNKFLVVLSDTKNSSTKDNFDAFIKEQEIQTGYNMYDVYNPQYDVFNFYNAGADDKKWLKNNKITDDPVLLILNGSGDILATSKSGLSDQQYQFSYGGNLHLKLQRANVFMVIDKVFKNKKSTDADLIRAFNLASALELLYDYDSGYSGPADFVVTKVALDKKEVSQNWKKLIENHQKDAKPDLYLVESILKEIKNQGFTKQLFNEDRVLNDTDFFFSD